jgi:hypothetical protein
MDKGMYDDNIAALGQAGVVPGVDDHTRFRKARFVRIVSNGFVRALDVRPECPTLAAIQSADIAHDPMPRTNRAFLATCHFYFSFLIRSFDVQFYHAFPSKQAKAPARPKPACALRHGGFDRRENGRLPAPESARGYQEPSSGGAIEARGFKGWAGESRVPVGSKAEGYREEGGRSSLEKMTKIHVD